MSWPLQVYLVTLALILKVRVLIHTFRGSLESQMFVLDGAHARAFCSSIHVLLLRRYFKHFSCAVGACLCLHNELRHTCDLNFMTMHNRAIIGSHGRSLIRPSSPVAGSPHRPLQPQRAR